MRSILDSCPNKHMGTSSFMPQDSSGPSDDSDDDDDSALTRLEVVIIVAAVAMVLSVVVHGYLFYRSHKSGDGSSDYLVESMSKA